MDKSKAIEALIQTDRDFAEMSLKVGAAEAFNAFLADEALELPAGDNPVSGRETIYQQMKRSEVSYTLAWEPQFGDVSDSGEMGYTWGNYTVSVKNDANGTVEKSYGKYLNVWKKNDAGEWRVVVDMGNASPEPENS
ncbi:MAG: nuclear transport factor 2 family protein [Candidatus Neomarinimicrobiota bacterium]